VQYYLKKALGELSEVMGEIQDVKSYQYAQLPAEREPATMIPIRSARTWPCRRHQRRTEALTAVETVVPCMQVGENCFEDEGEW
jgi:hypothetical protein